MTPVAHYPVRPAGPPRAGWPGRRSALQNGQFTEKILRVPYLRHGNSRAARLLDQCYSAAHVRPRRDDGPQARRRHCHRPGPAFAGRRLRPGQAAPRPADRGNARCVAGPGPRRPARPGQRQERCGARGGLCPAPGRPGGHRDRGIRGHAAGARSPQRGHRQQRRPPGRHPCRGAAGTGTGPSSRPCTWGTTARASGSMSPSGPAPWWATRCTCTWWATAPSGRRWRSWRASLKAPVTFHAPLHGDAMLERYALGRHLPRLPAGRLEIL